jgi:glyceraldehyde-3-phosphate dehydrogenase/erythrose-4-phosphate dehydrogenase
MRVGISGMGRIGRLALRAAMGAAERPEDDPRRANRLEVVHLNEIKGGAAATAHLLEFDSVQGRWGAPIAAEGTDAIRIQGSGGKRIARAHGILTVLVGPASSQPRRNRELGRGPK